MLKNIRTDLASEAHSLWRQSAGNTTRLEGVEAHDEELNGCTVTSVEILNDAGASVLCKPVGKYYTLNIQPLLRRQEDGFENAVQAASSLLGRLSLPADGELLVACLGNPNITPDAIGPLTAESVLVTRHLKRNLPQDFAAFRSVSVMRTGVLGTTGLESAESIKAVCDALHPACVFCVDALASADLERLGCTVQICDTGISPGSGVGNDRAALNQESLGVPVIAIGVPTVVDAGAFSDEEAARGMYVTPRNIDDLVRTAAKAIGYAINFALHPGITFGDIDMLLE